MEVTGTSFHHIPQQVAASHSLVCLHEMQQQGQLCDVVLETNADHQIAAHRVVLAAASPYFRAMFINKLIESTKTNIYIQEVDYDILQAIVAYAYNAEFLLPSSRVLQLMVAADCLQIIQLRQLCSNFLQTQIRPDNCLGMRAFSGLHNCIDLFNLCTKYIADHFEEVTVCDEYLYLPCDQLKDLISKDEVRVTCEEKVYSAVMRWVYHDLDSRKDAFPEIMSQVRLPFVSYQFLSGSVEQEALVQNQDQCKLYVQEAYTYKTSPEKRPQLRESPRAKPRKTGLQDVILTAGGMCKNNPISAVEQYEFDSNTWTVLCNLETARFGLAACFHNGCLYAVGGYNDALGYLDSVECYNIRENRWSKAASMIQPRRYHAVHLLYGLIYAIGGQNAQGILSSVECYNPDANQWTAVADMNIQRMYHGVAEMDGLLFAVGGHSGPTRLSSVEFYDPTRDKWTYVCPMSTPRSVAGVASLGGSIYAAGGYNGKTYLNSVESYDVEMDKWFTCVPMNTCRSAMGLVDYSGCLYACGGFNGSFETSVEKYTSSAQTWEACADMLIEKVHFGLART